MSKKSEKSKEPTKQMITTVGYVDSDKDHTNQYVIYLRGGVWCCDCKAYLFSEIPGRACKHIRAVRTLARVEVGAMVQRRVKLTKKGVGIVQAWRESRGLPLVRPEDFKVTKAQLPFVRGSDTSEDAAKSMGPQAARLREIVFNAIRAAGKEGLTCDETEALMGRSHQSVSPRFGELRRDELVVDSGLVRRTRGNRNAAVHVAVEFVR